MVLTDAQWAVLERLIEACRPHRKTQHHDLRRTMEAIIWRCQNGARWRAAPAGYGPRWMAALTFISWGKHGVGERLLNLVQETGLRRGMAFLDGSNIRAHQKAAGALKKGDLEPAATCVRRLADLVVAMAPRPAGSLMAAAVPSRSIWHLARPMNCRRHALCSAAGRRCQPGGWLTAAPPATPGVSTSGTSAPGPPSRRSGRKRQSPARPGSPITAIASSGSGHG